MLLSASRLEQQQDIAHLLSLACLLAALLEERDIFNAQQRQLDCDISHRVAQLFQQPKKGNHQRILQQAQRLFRIANQQVNQKSNSAKRFCNSVASLPIKDCGLILVHAYPERIAKQRNNQGHYLTAYGKGVVINEADALAGERYIIAAQLFQRQQTLTVSLAAHFELEQAIAWGIVEVQVKTQLHFDEQLNRIVSTQQQVIGALVIKEENTKQKLSDDLLIVCWCQQIQKKGLNWLKFDAATQQLLLRWRWLNSTQTHLEFPVVSEEFLINNLAQWLGPYLTNITTKNQLDKLDFSALLLSQLSYQQQQIFKKVAPTFFIGPTERKCTIRYSLEQAPIVSLPMQELYGVTETPAVGDKANHSEIPLIIEILSPAKRPIQVTQDLVAFWQGSYRAVQKDMKAQYPKHFWPDDPANAQATRKVKRHL